MIFWKDNVGLCHGSSPSSPPRSEASPQPLMPPDVSALGKDTGMGNTGGFCLGVCRGMGMVLTFCTHKNTIPMARGTTVLPPYPQQCGGLASLPEQCYGHLSASILHKTGTKIEVCFSGTLSWMMTTTTFSIMPMMPLEGLASS